jgi:hypothetical protein
MAKTAVPTPEQAAEYLTPEQIEGFESLASKLEDVFGPPPQGLYMVGWLVDSGR